jgi:hypothetical protein
MVVKRADTVGSVVWCQHLAKEEHRGVRNNWVERYSTPLILICVFIFFTALVYRILNQASPKLEPASLSLLNNIVVLGTALVLIWYTYETYKLREAAQKQIELQQRPFVILEVSISDRDEFSYRVRNIGVGTAINVRIMDIRPDGAEWSFHFAPRFFPVLQPQETQEVRPSTWFQDSRDEQIEEERISRVEHGRFSVRIEFYNVDTTLYYVSQQYTSHTMTIRNSGPIHDRA